MLHVDGKPMLEILLANCIASGFRQFYFSVNYLKQQIIDYFRMGVGGESQSIIWLRRNPLTAGSLQFLPDTVKQPFLVINGDILTRLDLIIFALP